MAVTLKPKSYGPLLLASAHADHLAFTTEGGYQAAGVRTSQPEGLSPPDLLLASVLRQIRHDGLMDGHPNVKAFYARALTRPAWARTLALYAERLGVAPEALA